MVPCTTAMSGLTAKKMEPTNIANLIRESRLLLPKKLNCLNTSEMPSPISPRKNEEDLISFEKKDEVLPAIDNLVVYALLK
jgi:hypothetical protein